jgi:holo-[acyl-carrier protein] synthase|tara:strand:- start:4138 stop:4482 length:345 start_codon:yes stop_codon:yes gene_type:complete
MDISNIGIDIIDIDRFRKKDYSNNKKFYQRIFSESEIKYCLSFKNSSEHFAGRFAIKEAVKKSIKDHITFKQILTTHRNSRPKIILKKKLNYKFLVSVSHEANIAIAIVIAFKK